MCEVLLEVDEALSSPGLQTNRSMPHFYQNGRQAKLPGVTNYESYFRQTVAEPSVLPVRFACENCCVDMQNSCGSV